MPDKTQTGNKDWGEVSNREIEDTAEENLSDAVEPEHEPSVVPEDVEALQEKLEAAKQDSQKHYEMFLRTQAEMENLKRRSQKDLESAHKYGVTKLVKDLIPVLDSLEQGLQTEVGESEELLLQMHKGLVLTYQMLLDTAKKYGIEQLDPVGSAFDPEQHEAVSMVESPDHAKNTVISVFQKGYVLNGRLLRAARVIVAK